MVHLALALMSVSKTCMEKHRFARSISTVFVPLQTQKTMPRQTSRSLPPWCIDMKALSISLISGLVLIAQSAVAAGCDFERPAYGSGINDVSKYYNQGEMAIPDDIPFFEFPVAGEEVCSDKAFHQGGFMFRFYAGKLAEIEYTRVSNKGDLVKALENRFGVNPDSKLLGGKGTENLHLFWDAKESAVLYFRDTRMPKLVLETVLVQSKQYSKLIGDYVANEEALLNKAIKEEGDK